MFFVPLHLCKQGFLLLFPSSCSLQPRRTVTTALVRNCIRASHDSWWHEELMHLLSSPCQASLDNGRSCVHKNGAIDLPTVGSKLCVVFQIAGGCLYTGPLTHCHLILPGTQGAHLHLAISAKSPGVLVRRTWFCPWTSHLLAGWPRGKSWAFLNLFSHM